MNQVNPVLQKLNSELTEVYGPSKAVNITMRVIPGILADFQKMLADVAAGEKVRETYNLEDGRASVTLTGTRARGISYISMIEKAEVNRR